MTRALKIDGDSNALHARLPRSGSVFCWKIANILTKRSTQSTPGGVHLPNAAVSQVKVNRCRHSPSSVRAARSSVLRGSPPGRGMLKIN